MKALEDELFQRWELTSQQYNVLRILQAAYPKPVPTLQISSRLISRAPDITRMLDKLQDRELVQRNRSDMDRRTVFVQITDQGLKLLENLREPVKSLHISQLGHLSAADCTELCSLLEKARSPHEPSSERWSLEPPKP